MVSFTPAQAEPCSGGSPRRLYRRCWSGKRSARRGRRRPVSGADRPIPDCSRIRSEPIQGENPSQPFCPRVLGWYGDFDHNDYSFVSSFLYAYAVKADPWIFLTGHEAFDFESGIPEEVAGPSGFPLRAAAQPMRGRFYPQRMRRILREFGSELGNAVRLDQYYPSPAAVDPYHLARHAEFGDYIPPSTSVVMERCFAAETNISTSLIAVMPGHEIQKFIHQASALPQLGLRAGRCLRRFRLRRRAEEPLFMPHNRLWTG
jgi:hypothetical protein